MFSVVVMQAHTSLPSIELAITNDFTVYFPPQNRHHGEIILCSTTAIALHFTQITGFHFSFHLILKPCMKDNQSL